MIRYLPGTSPPRRNQRLCRRLLSLLLGVVVISMAGICHANSINDMDQFGPQPTDWTTMIQLDKFNQPGTLNSIQIILDGTLTGTADFENPNTADKTVKGTVDLLVTLSGIPGLTSMLSVNPLFQTGSFVLHNGSPVSFPILEDESVSFFVNPADFALFSGPGSFMLNLFTTTSITTMVTGGGSIIANYDSQASGKATIVYDFTPPDQTVPEPMTMLLVGSGLLGLTVLHRRRQPAA